MSWPAADSAIRKGAVCWLRHREREGSAQTLVIAVQSPDFL
jgi:phosphohistidine phosphatase